MSDSYLDHDSAEDTETFLLSRHAESRPGLPGEPGAFLKPLPVGDERYVREWDGAFWLFEVPGGYRLVNLIVNGQTWVWEMPGYSEKAAKVMAHMLADGYLDHIEERLINEERIPGTLPTLKHE